MAVNWRTRELFCCCIHWSLICVIVLICMWPRSKFGSTDITILVLSRRTRTLDDSSSRETHSQLSLSRTQRRMYRCTMIFQWRARIWQAMGFTGVRMSPDRPTDQPTSQPISQSMHKVHPVLVVTKGGYRLEGVACCHVSFFVVVCFRSLDALLFLGLSLSLFVEVLKNEPMNDSDAVCKL